jgi:drug/metabolite transporter (DMT)-like permease
MTREDLAGAWSGLASALLFGVSTPVAKALLPASGPFMMAGLLYLGAGAGLVLTAPLRARGGEAPLGREDVVPLAAVVVLGGIAAPVLLMLGLARLPGSTASLLLNLETPFTIAIAVGLFRESLDRREVLGAAAILAGAVALAAEGGPGGVQLAGALAVAGACLGWAIDNNLSGRLALHDPVAVVQVKSLVAGAASVALALAVGERPPPAAALAGALVTGFLGYGVALVLFMRAMRRIGAARQSALFATAPFAGAIASVPILGDRLSARELAVAAAMAAGVAVLLGARHSHVHEHEPLSHDHAHVHDDHHRHDHAGDVDEPHAHPHGHPPLVHDHPHVADVHHRHRHR